MEMPRGVSTFTTIGYAPGYLFYVENMVLGDPFDETSLRLIGERRRVVSGLPGGTAAFSVSSTEVLAYWTNR